MYIEGWLFWTAVAVFAIESVITSKWISMVAVGTNKLGKTIENMDYDLQNLREEFDIQKELAREMAGWIDEEFAKARKESKHDDTVMLDKVAKAMMQLEKKAQKE